MLRAARQRRDDLLAALSAVQECFKDFDPDEVERELEKALAEARAEVHAELSAQGR